jgi:carboxymethylenebutenolidase
MRPFISLLIVLLMCGSALAQVPDFIRKTAQQAGQFDPEKQAQDAPKDNTPDVLPPTDLLATHLSAWTTFTAADGTKVRLFYAHPDYRVITAPAKLPALVVVQEWWGLNDDIQQRTKDLADKGYYAVAVDLYDGRVTADPKEAAQLKSQMTDPAALLRMKTAVDFLTAQATAGIVDADKIGVIGWCVGGEQSLKLSVADPRIKATAIFYGPLITDPKILANIHGPVLGIFGNLDQRPSPADVDGFEKALKYEDIPVTIYRFDGVGHAFASPSAKALGLYHEKEAGEAFEKAYAWLAANLQKSK